MEDCFNLSKRPYPIQLFEESDDGEFENEMTVYVKADEV